MKIRHNITPRVNKKYQLQTYLPDKNITIDIIEINTRKVIVIFKKSSRNYIVLKLHCITTPDEFKHSRFFLAQNAALGAGNGGLPWDEVKAVIELQLQRLEAVDIPIYEPFE